MKTTNKKIQINKIDIEDNIRTGYKKDDLAKLMQSIEQHGLLQPVGVVPKKNGRYKYLYGARRIKAHQKLGYKTIQAVVHGKDFSSEEDFLILNTTENVQRKNITPLELGRVVRSLLDIGLSMNEIVARLGINKGKVTNSYKLFSEKLPAEIVKNIVFDNESRSISKRAGKIPLTTVMTVVNNSKWIGKTERNKIISAAQKGNWSTAKTRSVVRNYAKADSKNRKVEKYIKKSDDLKTVHAEFTVNKKKYLKLRKKYKDLSLKEMFILMLKPEFKRVLE